MRLFTAICFEDETKNALFSAEKELEKASSGKFSIRENLHLTLVFIGETEKEKAIEEAISRIDFPSFEYKISGFGTFEKGIFWAGVEENKSLFELWAAIKNELLSIGIETEEREFIPHITLAKKFRPEEKNDFSSAEKLLPKNPQKATRISLMKSERIDDILRYTEIFSKNLI